LLSGEHSVKAQCLPFGRIPHTTPLFADFLADFSRVQKFYPRPPLFSEWFKDETARLSYDATRREQVASILERQNKQWDGFPKTQENIARFRAGAAVVVTGQQVGLFGGPVFSLYKALSAVKLAAEATAGGAACVPVFWLATTDHDLAEVNHTSILGSDGRLTKLTAPSHGLPDAPVGRVVFGPEIESVVEEAIRLLGDSEVADWLRQSYRPGENMGSAFARLFARIFAEWGVIILDASDPELQKVAAPIYRAAIERADALDDALLARGKELESAGYHQQVKVTPSSTLLFTLRNGARLPVHRRTNGKPAETEFLIGEEKISGVELLRQINERPQDFSPNVLLRPVVQDYLLPTLAYTGGAAEVAYFAQAAVAYEMLLGRATPILPRFSATLIEPKVQRLLEKYGMGLTDLFHGPEHLRETLAKRALPADLQAAFDRGKESLEQSLSAVRNALAQLDKTLLEACDNAASKMQYQLDQLRTRAARAELRQSELVGRHAETLSNALYPEKALQEREVAGISFLARNGMGLLHQLYGTMHTDCHDHQVVEL
jgi:bacillithiol synthase